MAKRMGHEGELYYGTAGSTAGTELTIARDVTYSWESTEADISDRSSIIDLVAVAGIKFSLEFEVLNQDSNAFISTLRTAASGGTALAFATKDKASGYGVDADFVVSVEESQTLRDAQRIKVTCMPTDTSGRTPSWS